MKKTHYNLKYKPDPILVGDSSPKVINLTIQIPKYNSAIWNGSRKLRDNGQVAKQNMKWKVDPTIKRNFYGERLKTEISHTNSRILDQ